MGLPDWNSSLRPPMLLSDYLDWQNCWFCRTWDMLGNRQAFYSFCHRGMAINYRKEDDEDSWGTRRGVAPRCMQNHEELMLRGKIDKTTVMIRCLDLNRKVVTGTFNDDLYELKTFVLLYYLFLYWSSNLWNDLVTIFKKEWKWACV